MTRFLLLLAILWLCSTVCNAQITTGEHPFSWDIELKTRTSVPIVDLDLPDISTILSEDEESQRQGNPFIRTAVPVPVCINMSMHGEWIELSTGDRIWRVQIDAIDALSLDLSFDQLWLPQGGKLFVYNPGSDEVIGAITSEYLRGSMSRPADFSTGVIRGNQLVIEYYQPKWLKIMPVLSISNVYYGYRDIPYTRITRDYGNSGSCQVNVNCAEGANWQKEKRAVARIYVKYSGGGGWCTGALMNNTSGDMSALFLTADHCLLDVFDAAGNTNLSQWIFYWDYECHGCTCSASPTVKSTVGATVLANNKISDFALLRLMQDPRNLEGFIPYYLGWDRTENPSASGVGIHHPRGDVKKIATYSMPLQNSTCVNYNFWQLGFVKTVNGHSVMEPGSSGSPLLAANKRIVGQLLGPGNLSLCPERLCGNSPSLQRVSYGKFSVSWTGGGTTDSRRKLQPWLDPQGTNPQSFDGMEALPPVALSGPTQICDAGSFSLSNLPTGATVQWATGGGRWNSLELASGQGTARATYRATGSGQGTVTATVSLNGASSTLSQTVWAGAPSAELDVSSDGIARASACLRTDPLTMHAEPPVWQLWNPSQRVNFVEDEDGRCGRVRGAAGDWNIGGTVTVRNGCGEATGRFSMSGTSQTDPCPRLIEQRGSGSNLAVMYTKPIDCPVWPIRGLEQPTSVPVIEVYDRMGRLVLRQRGEQAHLGGLRPGLYIVRAHSGDEVATLTVVRE